MDEMEKKVIVTGAAGFIGSHLCERLISEGYRVTAVDSLTDYYDPERKRRHLARIIPHDRMTFLEEDLNHCELDGILDGAVCVFHLAAQAGVRMSWGREFSHYVDSNILATQRLLEALKSKGSVRLVYSSSSSIYGESANLPMREEDKPNPLSPYGVTKLSGEHLCVLYNANFGTDFIALRYFTVYGPRQRPDMAFSRFVTSALRGEPVDVYGDGKQTRDFTFVSDAVRANMLAMKYEGGRRIFNIGGGSRVSILEVLKIIGEKTGRRMRIDFLPKAEGDVRDTWADTARASRELGFSPEVGLEEGIEKEIEWYREHLRS